MTTYNPVRKPTVTDVLRGIYWSSTTARLLAEGAFLLTGIAILVLTIVALVPVR